MRVAALVCLGVVTVTCSLPADQPLPAATAPPPSQSIGAAQRRVPPSMMYHHVWIVSPLVGSGKPGDPKRPVLVPAPSAPGAAHSASPTPAATVAAPAPVSGGSTTAPAAATAQTGLVGFQMQLSDDGKYALAELVFVTPLAFQTALKNEVAARSISVTALPAASAPAAVSAALESALQTAVPGLQIFERGQATESQILSAFQQKKAAFSFSSGNSVRP